MIMLHQNAFILPLLIVYASSLTYTIVGLQDSNPNNDLKQDHAGIIPLHSSSHHHHQAQSGPIPRVHNTANVDDFGAKGDGRDDTEAFKKAWKKACSSKTGVLLVPGDKTYHLKPITLSGPCQPDFTVKIHGEIIASTNQSEYRERRHWIIFKSIHNFKVQGGGTINGNGQIWWNDSCKINKTLPCLGAPTAVTFEDCKNLRVNNLRFKNPQQIHLSFQNSKNVRVSRLEVTAPEKSPNTDGIHVSATQNIHISRSIIRTGDDCISIIGGSKNIQVSDIMCGPGHGISIGSLGKNGSEDKVSDVVVNRVTLSRTTNGVRIKTWQGGSGYAKNIKFENIVMYNVTNPIIIDQNYCDQHELCPEQHSAVQVENVVYKKIKGTSSAETAVKFDCSKTFPCQGIELQDVNLRLQETNGDVKSLCKNAWLGTRGRVSPGCSCNLSD